MRDFPSCFGENGVQIADSSSSSSSSSSNFTTKSPQNLVTCIYQCKLRGSSKSCLITITWSKSLMGQGLSIGIEDPSKQSLCKIDIKPWLFSKRRGSKSLESYSSKFDIYWDLSSAKFGSGPEPLEGFYLIILMDREMILLLGDLRKEAFKKINLSPSSSNASFVAKKEHLFGKKVFSTKARFFENGLVHDLVIECDSFEVKDPFFVIRIDGKSMMQVKRLQWKFRGNHTILIEGLEIEVFWDVHNWLFGSSLGKAVFMFKTSLCTEKLGSAHDQPFCDSNVLSSTRSYNSQKFAGSKSQCLLGFSLILYAWKNG